MTEISLHAPRLPFPSQAQQQADSGGRQQVQQGDGNGCPVRCAVHGNETFIPRGTSEADLASLFPQRAP